MAARNVQHTISKTVRLPMELVNYVEAYEGRDFSKKLVNILYEFRDGEEQRAYKIAQYDAMVEERRKRLRELTDTINDASKVARNISGIYQSVEAGALR